MANENQPGQAPAHLSSQNVPAGNQTNGNSAPIEKQFLELQRREKELVKREAALKGAVPFDSLKERAKQDRNNLLRELGLDDLIQEDSNDPVVSLRKEMEALKAATQKKEQDEARARELQDFKSQLHGKQDEFELLIRLGYEDKAFDLLKNSNPESGETPDPFSVAKQLDDAIFNDISKLKGSKRLADLFKSEAPQPRHPMDKAATISSSDGTQTQAAPSAPTENRYQQIMDAAKHLKFD